MATHIISRTHPHLGPNVVLLQTTNPTVEVEEGKVVSRSWFERVKVTKGSKVALEGFLLPAGEGGGRGRRGRYQGIEGVWFCGSWCAEGIPLLEGCVRSAERVVEALLEEVKG